MAAVALDKKWLARENDRENRRRAREKLRALRLDLKNARERRKIALMQAADRCRAERLATRERIRQLRARVLADLAATANAERAEAKRACKSRAAEARAIRDDVERARAHLRSEEHYHRDLRRIERSHKQRQAEAPAITRITRRSESDDEVRANIPTDLIPLFERVRRGIKATPRMSRTESFLKYAEEHPHEVLEVIEDRTDAMIRDLERRAELEARSTRRRSSAKPGSVRRPKYTAAELAAVPF